MLTLTDIRIPVMSFRSSGIMFYEVNANHRGRLQRSTLFNSNAQKLAKRERYKGYVTASAKKRMKKAITLLLQSTPYEWKLHPVTGKQFQHKISFITLTTPTHENSYNGKWCHTNLLQPMLRILRTRYGMKSYIWKIELQENKQVHYHLTCDVALNHTRLRTEWNNLLIKHDMLEDFKIRYGHTNPNSTDIHSVNKVRNLEAYLVKYITKEYQNESALNCKIWDCSKNLKANDYFKVELDHGLHQYIRSLQKSFLVFTSYFERAIFLDFKTTDYYANFSSRLINEFSNYLKSVREWEKNTTAKAATAMSSELQNLKKSLKSFTQKSVGCQLTLQTDTQVISTDWRLKYHQVMNE